MKKILKRGLFALMAALLFVMAPLPILPQNVQLQTVEAASVKLNKSTLTLVKGKSSTLKVTGTSAKVKWSSSKKSVATVSSKGKVTAKKKGTATITAKVNGETYTCKVTVVSKSLTISTSNVSITDTESEDVKVTFVKSGTVYYKVADTSIVSCSWGKWSGYNIPLTITGKKAGSTTVTITNTANSLTCTINVTVKETEVESIKLSDSELTLEDGESGTLTATVYPSNASERTITWTSSNSEVATVNSSGVVKAKSCGNATITAEAGGKKATCEVTVYVPVTINLPEVPVNISDYSYSGKLKKTCTVTDVWYEVSKSGDEYYYKIYISGQKIYDSEGNTTSSSCRVGYKLYDEDGAVVESGTIYSSGVCVGEKFSGQYTNGFIGAGNYTLVLLNVK